MALNWYLTLRNLSKTDARAAEIMEQLKIAETNDEKESAKKIAQEYLQEVQPSEVGVNSEDATENTPDTVVASEAGQNSVACDDEDIVEGNAQDPEISNEEKVEKEQITTDLSQPAFTPRLAKFGITREEELFLNGVMVRKMTRDEKILMRRSIYQKKTIGSAKIQAEFKARRIEQKKRDANDPEKQRFHQERRYVSSIVEALEQNKNLGWVFSKIEGLTVDIFRELIKKPGIVNVINQANPAFITNFKKKYGK